MALVQEAFQKDVCNHLIVKKVGYNNPTTDARVLERLVRQETMKGLEKMVEEMENEEKRASLIRKRNDAYLNSPTLSVDEIDRLDVIESADDSTRFYGTIYFYKVCNTCPVFQLRSSILETVV